MSKRYLKVHDVGLVISLIDKITSMPTWTKEKHKLKAEFFKFIRRNYRNDFYFAHVRFSLSDGRSFYAWSYEIKDLPKSQRGYLSKYAGRKIFLVCVGSYDNWGRKIFLVLPINKFSRID